MKTANTIFPFVHNFGAGAGDLTCTVEAGSLCKWHDENSCWYVCPGQVPAYAQHDANYRGIPVPRANLVIHGEPWTRKEYMDADTLTNGAYDGSKGHDAHHAYFCQFVNDWVISTVLERIGADTLRASRDVHLNDIPLKLWDDLPMTRAITEKAKELGDNTSLGTKVCIYKAAARHWLRGPGEGLPLWRVRYQYPAMPGDDPHWLYSYAVGSDPESALVAYRAANSMTVKHEIINCEGNKL